MKRIFRNSIGILGAAVLATQLVGATPAVAARAQNSSTAFEQAMPITAEQEEINQLLQNISGNAAIAGKHAGQLESFTRVGSRLHQETHAAELMGAKHAVNAMGSDLRRLQELRPGALPWQQAVIERIEPVMVDMAGHATSAIEQLGGGRVPHPAGYRESVLNMYAAAGQVRNIISVNLDYAEAREKLNRLDPSVESFADPLPSRNTAAEPSKTSKNLEERVRTELAKLPYYGVFDYLAFQIDGDRVRLVGEASWPALKTDAERAARSVEGVEGVINDIKILPVSPNDDRIRLATYWAVYGNAALAPYRLNPQPPIRIIVENGSVILKGVVRSEIDRRVAHAQANGVPGAFSVTNNLQLGS